jgi:hypothetical protein
MLDAGLMSGLPWLSLAFMLGALFVSLLATAAVRKG